MNLVDRMVLLVLENASNNCVTEDNLQLVLSVMNRRYGLRIEHILEHFDIVLARLSDLYIEKSLYGYRLGDGGRAELLDLHLQQDQFCRKFAHSAQVILKRNPNRSSRRDTNAPLRLPVHTAFLPVQQATL